MKKAPRELRPSRLADLTVGQRLFHVGLGEWVTITKQVGGFRAFKPLVWQAKRSNGKHVQLSRVNKLATANPNQ